MSPYLMTASALAALSDGDDAATDELVARRRANTTVAQAQLAAVVADPDRLSVNLLTEFRAAWYTGDHDQMSAVMLAAIDLDRSAPGAPRLMDEIRGLSTPAAA